MRVLSPVLLLSRSAVMIVVLPLSAPEDSAFVVSALELMPLELMPLELMPLELMPLELVSGSSSLMTFASSRSLQATRPSGNKTDIATKRARNMARSPKAIGVLQLTEDECPVISRCRGRPRRAGAWPGGHQA